METRKKLIVAMVMVILVLMGGAARATQYYVSPDGSDGASGTSWATAWATLPRAMSGATSDGDVVDVNEGTYCGSCNETPNPNVWEYPIDPDANITIRSTDPNDPCVVKATKISGAVSWHWPSLECNTEMDSDYWTRVCNLSTDSRLVGFTILAGPDTSGFNKHNGERAIYCNDSSPTISKCRIIGYNNAYSDLTGIDCNNSSAVISDCTIKGLDNAVQAIYVDGDNSDVNIVDCTIIESEGRGIHAVGGNSEDLTIKGSTISGTGGDRGILFGSAGGLKIIDTTISGYEQGIYHCGGNTAETPVGVITMGGCTITDNGGGTIDGGGLFLYKTYQGAIRDCNFISNHSDDGGAVYIHQECSDVNFVNCQMVNNEADVTGGGILIVANQNGQISFVDCVISDNTAGKHGGGIYSTAEEKLRLINCTIAGNEALGESTSDAQGGGIYSKGDLEVRSCLIAGNKAFVDAEGNSGGGGIWLTTDVEDTNIINCTIADNWTAKENCGGGMYVIGTNYDADVNSCIFWDNKSDTTDDQIYKGGSTSLTVGYSDVEGGWTGIENIDSDPCFVDFDANDFHLKLNSPCIDAGDPDGDYEGEVDIDGDPRLVCGRVEMGADEVCRVHNITQDKWYAYIQDAIDEANTGDTIEVYQSTSYENIDFKGRAITLRSTDPNDWDVVEATIINGNQAKHVVKFDSSEDANSILSGFTVTGGNAYGGYYLNQYGAGILCYQTSPTISRCIIKGNNAQTGGGGMYIFADVGQTCSPTVTNCFFVDNDSGASGGGIWNDDCEVTVVSCVFAHNTAGAHGGGFLSNGSASDINNCTFAYNSATSNGGGIYNGGSATLDVYSSIFWGNSDSGGTDEEAQIYIVSSMPTVKYSCIQDMNSGGDFDSGGNTNNIDDDPCFVDADANDFHLSVSPNSPCIDRGDPAGGDYYGQTDIDGDARVMTLEVDMGADEAAYFPTSHPDYSEWANVGEPNCWCYRRQCRGDSDNTKNGDPKQGYFYVGAGDLNLLVGNWRVKEPPKGSGIVYLGEPNMCADVDHAQGGSAKGGYYRVGSNDLNVLFAYWNIKEPPKGSGVDPNCFE